MPNNRVWSDTDIATSKGRSTSGHDGLVGQNVPAKRHNHPSLPLDEVTYWIAIVRACAEHSGTPLETFVSDPAAHSGIDSS